MHVWLMQFAIVFVMVSWVSHIWFQCWSKCPVRVVCKRVQSSCDFVMKRLLKCWILGCDIGRGMCEGLVGDVKPIYKAMGTIMIATLAGEGCVGGGIFKL